MIGNPLVSVIITTKDEEVAIKSLLQSIKKQSYGNIEIILIDNNSTDKTKEIAKSLGSKVYSFGPERSAQRNYGAKIAKGKYLFFLDADMQLTKNIVKECVENSKGIGGIIIPEVSVAIRFWEKVKAFERTFYNIDGGYLIEAARFFNKKIFENMKGYDETITGPEDWDLTERIEKSGFKIGRIKKNIYHKEKIPSIATLLRKKYYYALSAHTYLSKHKVSVFNSKTVYFFRPVFYKNWKKILKYPILSSSLFILLFLEQIAGGFGYIRGRIKKA